MNHHSHILKHHKLEHQHRYHENVRVDHGRSWSGRPLHGSTRTQGAYVGRCQAHLQRNGSRACEILRTKTMSKRSAAQVSDDGRDETCSSHRFGRKTRVQKCVQEDNQWMFQVSTYVRGRPCSLQNRHSLFYIYRYEIPDRFDEMLRKEIFSNAGKLLVESMRSPTTGLCHGDPRLENFYFFKDKETGERSVGVLDFQLMILSSVRCGVSVTHEYFSVGPSYHSNATLEP